MNEGWVWLSNSPKWHYFVKGRSLCGRFGLFGKHDFVQEDGSSPDNCKACQKKLAAWKRPATDAAAKDGE